jgi:HAD superfamily hydrolase (TIGR01484 family)
MKLLACDLLGTIHDEAEVVIPQLKERFDRLRSKGVKIAFASARPFKETLKLVEKNSLGPRSGYPHLLIDAESAYELKSSGYEPLFSYRAEFMAQIKEYKAKIEAIHKHLEEELGHRGFKYKRLTDAESHLDLFSFEDLNQAQIGEALLKSGLEGLPLKPWRNRVYLSTIPRGMGKGAMLSRTCPRIPIRPEAVLTVGDSANDLEMLDGRYGFIPACVGNAEAPVKSVVAKAKGYIAQAEYGAGVCEIIDHYWG